MRELYNFCTSPNIVRALKSSGATVLQNRGRGIRVCQKILVLNLKWKNTLEVL
jgi:hypothetical protein